VVQRRRTRPILWYIGVSFAAGTVCGAGGLLCAIIGLLRAAAGP
jgi:hypothetical protein